MSYEFFPPTESELEERIQHLKKQLEDEKYKQHWVYIDAEKKNLEQQLQKLIIKNNAL